MIRITVAMSKTDGDALMLIAAKENRRPRQQAAFLLSQALQREWPKYWQGDPAPRETQHAEQPQ